LSSSEKLLTPAQAAEILSVSPITIRYWANEGKIKFITTPGGHRRFEPNEVDKLLNTNTDSNKKENIVIVEDDVQFADLLTEYINVLYPELEVNTAYSGFEAGTLIQVSQPCLIFLDIFMPKLDGLAVCQQIKAERSTKNIPIIAMSGSSEQEKIDKILAAGADHFLAKPIRLSELKKSVDLCLQKA